MSDNPLLSVIIPTLNEADCIHHSLTLVQHQFPGADIIVVDGGSSDGTRQIAMAKGVSVLQSDQGRGVQCNLGSAHARGDILLFLHADTYLTRVLPSVIAECFADPGTQIAKFRLRFDDDHRLLRFYERWTRFDSVFTSFGDQCLVVRKSFFQQMGGFPNWPLFEDVQFFRLSRQRTKIVVLPGYAVTSARRFLARGIIRTQLLNGWLLLQYLCGVSPFALNDQYRGNGASSLLSILIKRRVSKTPGVPQ